MRSTSKFNDSSLIYIQYFEIFMEQQEEAPIIDEEEEKNNNQPDMVSENPIDEERDELQNTPGQENNALDREEQMEQEEKVNQEQNEEISMENEAERNEAISEEVQVRGNEQQEQNQEPSNNLINSPSPVENQNQQQEQQEQLQQRPAVDLVGTQAQKDQEQELQPEPHSSGPSQHPEPAEKEQPPQHHNTQEAPQQVPQIQHQKEEREAQKSEQIVQNESVNIQSLAEEAQRQAQIHFAQKAASEQRRAQENFAYTNKLQRMIENLSESLAKSRNQQESLRNKNKALEAELSSSRQTVLDLRKKKMELDMDKLKSTKEIDKLKRQNADFKEKIAQIEKIGNVLVLQSSIEELRLLTSAQQQEILQLKESSTQQAHNYYQQQFQVLQAYQNQLNTLKEQNNSLNTQIQQVKTQYSQLVLAKQQIQNQNAFLKESISTHETQKISLKAQVSSWEKKWESFEDERAEFKRSRELDQKVSQYESQRFMGEENDVQIIPILSDKEEKNLLLKEYLKLETLYEECRNKQELAETRLKRVLRDAKIQQANLIRKKDYHDLLSRYRKAKTCLQGAFTKLKQLERVQASSKAIRQEVNQLLQGNQSRLCQTIIKRTNEQSQMVVDKIAEMELTDELITLKKDNARLKENQSSLERQVKISEKVITLLSAQLDAKKGMVDEQAKIIQRLIQAGYHHNSQHYEQRIADLQQQTSRQSEILSALEVKTILLIKENESHLQQINHWKSLYNSIKQQLSQKITVSLQSAANPVLASQIPAESNDFCRECERRNLQISLSAPMQQQGVQTESNYDLHYKEIKQSLICLKRINKEVQTIPESHQKTVKLITDFRDKYEKYIEKYNAKLMELRREKADNQAWRVRTRQEIREQFQDIRDIISNNRLATALRQAKSLIEYLQNEQEKGEEEKEQEEQGEDVPRQEVPY